MMSRIIYYINSNELHAHNCTHRRCTIVYIVAYLEYVVVKCSCELKLYKYAAIFKFV